MKVSEHVRTTITQDGAVLMDLRGGQMITLNPTGSIIWRHLSEGRSPAQIAGLVASEFRIPPEQAIADVNEFMEELAAQQLLAPSQSDDSRSNWNSKLTGLFCNLFGRYRTAQERGPSRK